MKTWLIVFIACVSLVVFSNFNCSKYHYNSNATQAIITGFDPRMCACCGGLVINFDGDSTLMSGKWYMVKNDPSTLGISTTSNFPMHVTVTYELQATQPCGGQGYVLLTSMQIR